ncbi:hypothetical protein FALBO_12542 [Fusarium albosuccineum]|uniref:Uncharacterized protein n=1 Tax=Fusarium albosuccineum TaxID=1237068 RepID=A0A8H4L3P8_9HYPO|nr:hypothetical protein FALBO_12542 [Fusarium albosuccineum]
MQYALFASFIAIFGVVHADLHKSAACVSSRDGSTFELLPNATSCACGFYLNRNTRQNHWDQCPDCTFDGTICNSADGHIGGDELFL